MGKNGAQGAAQNPSDPHGYGGAPQIGGFLGRGEAGLEYLGRGRPQLVGVGEEGVPNLENLGREKPKTGKVGRGIPGLGCLGRPQIYGLVKLGWGDPHFLQIGPLSIP